MIDRTSSRHAPSERPGFGNTIAAFRERSPLQPLCMEESDSLPAQVDENPALFKIRLADNEGHRDAASFLVKRRYGWRGYRVDTFDAGHPNRIALSACDRYDATLATISVGLDSRAGLFVDTLYRAEVDSVRAANGRVCEFTKLAVAGEVRSKPVLAALFHIAFIYARDLKGCTDLFVEVNPRHVSFYMQMLEFVVCGEKRYDARVNASAVLLRLDLEIAEGRIEEMGGRAELARRNRSLYPYFFSAREAAGIANRLRALD
ncbi:MAG TPA: N-acetyltransferase [Burkholderiales bacterium]|nr:N-acetyltransferase [Burkholderiales bacterium]